MSKPRATPARVSPVRTGGVHRVKAHVSSSLAPRRVLSTATAHGVPWAGRIAVEWLVVLAVGC